ncbi:unnamed protein product, partial [Staurois parvus]
MYTDDQGTDDQCALMISVAPVVPPVSVHQCQLSVLINATCQCPSVPPASSAHLCPAVRPLAPPTCAQQITHLCPAV